MSVSFQFIERVEAARSITTLLLNLCLLIEITGTRTCNVVIEETFVPSLFL